MHKKNGYLPVLSLAVMICSSVVCSSLAQGMDQGERETLKKELKEEIQAEMVKEPSGAESPLLNAFKGVKLSGFVDTNYFFNDDAPTGENKLSPLNYVGENENKSVTFESFTLFLDKEATEEHPVGWQLHTYFGEKAKRITFLGQTTTNDPDRNDIFTVATANVSWIAPVGKGITFTFGKFYTWIGAELVENINNPNYQHGILYNNAIPFTHTGISAGYDLTDKLHLTLYGVNGWDSFVDNNSSKSIGYYLSYEPTDKAFISFAGIHGAEGWNNDKGPIPSDVQRRSSTGGLTQMFDIVASYKLTNKLKLMLNGDWGIAEDGAMDIANGLALGTTGHWWGVAGYAIYDFTDWVQGVVRYEYFDDTDGVRFFDQSIWETTVTLNVKMRENLLFRPEYRHNNYSRPDVAGVRDSGEDIVGIGIEYLF